MFTTHSGIPGFAPQRARGLKRYGANSRPPTRNIEYFGSGGRLSALEFGPLLKIVGTYQGGQLGEQK